MTTVALLVAAAWLTGILFLLALCRAAARGDRYIEHPDLDWELVSPRPPRPRSRKRVVTLADAFRTLEHP